MAVTIKDVAREAGVSPITVSRAFSGTHPVAEETRAQIIAVARDLGYVPHGLARALVHQHIPMIGAVVFDLSNPFFAPIIDAFQEVTQQEDYLLVVNQSKYQFDLERNSIYQFRQMRLAGLLVVSIAPDLDHLTRLRSQGIAVVSVARPWAQGDYVTVDYFAGGYRVGKHLTGLGHRDFGCVAHDEPIRGGLWDRIQGFQAALREEGGLCRQEAMILTKAVRVSEGMRAADAFLARAERPTAVFVTADQLAIGFVHRLCERGVRVPEDVAVVGYDNIRFAAFMEVPLTTVALPTYEMGQEAARILFERIASDEDDEEGQTRQVVLQPELVVRASCGSSYPSIS